VARWRLLWLLLGGAALAQTASGSEPLSRSETERRAALDKALADLRAARSEQEAAVLAAQVRQLWLNAGSPAVTLLLGRGIRELTAGAPEDAVRDFDAALTLDPDHAEAWHQMALARFAAGDSLGAIAAIAAAVRHEPRHFAALQSLARIAEAREDWKGAYEAMGKALEIAPRLEGGQAKLQDLKRRALGDEM